MSYLSPADYLPHDAPMMLLERVERVTDSSAVCSVTVDGHGVLAPFLNVDGDLPGWFALELMAQTVGGFSGRIGSGVAGTLGSYSLSQFGSVVFDWAGGRLLLGTG